MSLPNELTTILCALGKLCLTGTDSLYDCLRHMIDNDISGVPIVNGDGVLVDVYTRFDLLFVN